MQRFLTSLASVSHKSGSRGLQPKENLKKIAIESPIRVNPVEGWLRCESEAQIRGTLDQKLDSEPVQLRQGHIPG